jgi:hypothetical protein
MPASRVQDGINSLAPGLTGFDPFLDQKAGWNWRLSPIEDRESKCNANAIFGLGLRMDLRAVGGGAGVPDSMGEYASS